MSSRLRRLATLAALLGICAGPAHAWGERGHHLVTRVAARLLAGRLAPATPLAGVVARKEMLLAHLSNVPDTVWRNQGEEIEKRNAPTHFLDMEYVAPQPSFDALPRALGAALARMKDLCARPPEGYVCPVAKGAEPDRNSAGTAPWRVGQMFRLTVAAMKQAGTGETLDAAAVDKAFTTAGLMSHFVGDLGNPYHTTRDYDGWETGAGGVHGYFEGAIVDSYPLSLEQQVFEAALAAGAFERVLATIPAAERAALSRDPVAIAMALGLDSHARLGAVAALDRKLALLKPSATDPEGKRTAAERRAPADVRSDFHAVVVERLATAADVLARLWLIAWEDAGRPDFRGYRSFAYPIAPEFVPADYLAR